MATDQTIPVIDQNSMTPIRFPNGCAAPILAPPFQFSLNQTCRRLSVWWRKSKGGFWASSRRPGLHFDEKHQQRRYHKYGKYRGFKNFKSARRL